MRGKPSVYESGPMIGGETYGQRLGRIADYWAIVAQHAESQRAKRASEIAPEAGELAVPELELIEGPISND